VTGVVTDPQASGTESDSVPETETGYRLGIDRGSPNHGSTLFSKRVMAHIRSPVRVPLHGARHSYATLALEAGIRPDVVSDQLGHSIVATTLNIYAHVSPAAGPRRRS
jgi:integrase